MTRVGVVLLLLLATACSSGPPSSSRALPRPCDLVSDADMAKVLGASIHGVSMGDEKGDGHVTASCLWAYRRAPVGVMLDVSRPSESWVEIAHELSLAPARPVPVKVAGTDHAAAWSYPGHQQVVIATDDGLLAMATVVDAGATRGVEVGRGAVTLLFAGLG